MYMHTHDDSDFEMLENSPTVVILNELPWVGFKTLTN